MEDVTLHTGACRSTTLAALANFVAEQIDATATAGERDELSTLWDNLTTVIVRRRGYGTCVPGNQCPALFDN